MSLFHHVQPHNCPTPLSCVLQPLKCLCGSAMCRGFIGGKEVANRTADPRWAAKIPAALMSTYASGLSALHASSQASSAALSAYHASLSCSFGALADTHDAVSATCKCACFLHGVMSGFPRPGCTQLLIRSEVLLQIQVLFLSLSSISSFYA